MNCVEACCEFTVELLKFVNVDLFERGYYQVKIKFKDEIKFKTQASLKTDSGEGQIRDGTYISDIFEINFRGEQIQLYDIILFKVNFLIDPLCPIDCINNADFLLNISLFFADNKNGVPPGNLELVNERDLRLRLTVEAGLHYSYPLMFDYFHLCAVPLIIHGQLLSIHHQINERHKTTRFEAVADRTVTTADMMMSGLEPALFGTNIQPGLSMKDVDSTRAYKVHVNTCYALLCAARGIQKLTNKLYEFLEDSVFSLDLVDINQKLASLQSKLKDQDSPEDFAGMVSRDLAQLSAEIFISWGDFLDNFLDHASLTEHLVQVHHRDRVQRFSEAFFTRIRSKLNAFIIQTDNTTELHNRIANCLRNTDYIRRFPPLPVECQGYDFDATSLPVLFEEKFVGDVEAEYQAFQNGERTNFHPQPRVETKPPLRNAIRKWEMFKKSAPTAPHKILHHNQKVQKKIDKERRQSLSNSLTDLSGGKKLTLSRSMLDISSLNDKKDLPNKEGTLTRQAQKSLYKEKRRQFSKFLKMIQKGSKKVLEQKSFLPTDNSPAITLQSVRMINEDSHIKEETLCTPVREATSLSRFKSASTPDVFHYLKQSSKKSLKIDKQPNDLNGIVNKEGVYIHISDSSDDEAASEETATSVSIESSHNSLPGNCYTFNLPTLNSPIYSHDNPDSGFEVMREKARVQLKSLLAQDTKWYVDHPQAFSIPSVPYFTESGVLATMDNDSDLHLVVCVHGLDGNSYDLRVLRTYIQIGLPGKNIRFLMSSRNQDDTFTNFETMTDRLIEEIDLYIKKLSHSPTKISFIGHSLGNVIIRSALSRKELDPYINRLHTFLSLSGPHLGIAYNTSTLVNTGLWFMQKWKKSESLQQLTFKDALNPRDTFLFKLSEKRGFDLFKNVLLISSHQDKYVPLHSARIEFCAAAFKDDSPFGRAYREMVGNIIQPMIKRENLKLVRYDVSHSMSTSTTNNLIGRTAHVAVLDSEIFIEKFFLVAGLKYFV